MRERGRERRREGGREGERESERAREGESERAREGDRERGIRAYNISSPANHGEQSSLGWNALF